MPLRAHTLDVPLDIRNFLIGFDFPLDSFISQLHCLHNTNKSLIDSRLMFRSILRRFSSFLYYSQ